MTNEISAKARAALIGMLSGRLAPRTRDRVESWAAASAQGSRRTLFVAFGSLPALVGKDELGLNSEERRACEEWAGLCGLSLWSMDQAARSAMVLHFPERDQEEALSLLFSAADVREQVALLRLLPLLPHAERHMRHAEAAVRSSLTSVFEAIAFDNAYPWLHFDSAQWNRMVLKALFQDLGVSRIQGLEERRNPELARMARDLMQERRSAQRPMPPGVDRVL